MSTEKSLLTINDVRFPQISGDDVTSGLKLPIGVTPTGTLEIATLKRDSETAHACIMGRVGSGKTKCVEFILKALYRMYGNSITLNYLDGKGCECSYWTKQEMPFWFCLACSEPQALTRALKDVIGYVREKDSVTPALVVLDDIAEELQSHEVRKLLYELYTQGPEKNVHMLWATQCWGFRVSDVPNQFDFVGATRLLEDTSLALFDSVVACTQAGVRRYGDLTYRYNGSISRVTVPFCPQHKED